MSDEPREVPRQLADFEILKRLGVGGMAEVFLAKKRGAEGTYKLLVVKRILPANDSRRFRTMFAEEAQLATRLNHPNIVQVYDFQDYGDEGQLLSMEYVEGPDLRRLQRAAQLKKTRIPPYVSAYIVAEVAKGLHYAHERRDEGGKPLAIVHRDVSPQNVLLSFDGAVKIADFGIASASLFRDEPGVLKGKTGYMSPEQARAEKVDRRTDIYSLGVVFHELLTGRSLHGALEGQELLEAVRAGQVEPPSLFSPDVPPELEAIAMRTLSRDKEERFQTARDFASAITRALFSKQELVDSHVLEVALGALVAREQTSPGIHASDSGEARAESESEHSDDVGESGASTSGHEAGQSSDRETGPGGAVRPLRARAGREVRHVAIVRIRLIGFDRLDKERGAAAGGFFDRLRGILDEIAFKRGARFTWDTPSGPNRFAFEPGATAVVGLLANPARSAADAASLAVDVHEAVQGASDDQPVPILASVGIVRSIATGRRDRAGHLVGHTLQEPAEYLTRVIAEKAVPGQTWVAGGLYRLVRRDFVWGDAPTIALEENPLDRPLPRNMRIYALERPLTREEKQLEMSNAARDLVGRDAELADLHAAYHRAVTPTKQHGIGHVTARAVIGEMGIGKTALVNALVNELPPDARVVRVECSPASSELPFAAVGQFVREFTNTRVDQPIDEARSIVREALGDFAGGRNREEIVTRLAQLATGRLAEASDEADVAHNRRLLTSGVRRLFARAAVEAPLVIVIDSLQWCDRPSLELVTTLVRRGDPLPVLSLLVTRPDDRVLPLLEGVVRVELRGLSAESQIRLIQAHLGATDGVAQVCADLIPRAAGNPFFLLEIVDALLERGALELRERTGKPEPELVRTERDQSKQPLPSTLEQLIADRLNELPPSEHNVVCWLAVTGGPLVLSDLRELAGPDADESVIRLCARGLCDDRGDAVDVRHPLTRDVAYMSIEGREREAMHRRLGTLFAGRPVAEGLGAAIVAQHLARGNSRIEAAGYYLQAASAAYAGYQLPLAARYYGRAIKLAPRTHTNQLAAFEALETIARIQGKWRERKRHLASLRRVARDSGKPYWVAVALIRTARFDLDAGRLARGLTLAQRGETVARGARSPALEVEAELLMAEMLRDLGDMQGALAACDRALETAGRGVVAERIRAEVFRAQGTLLLRVGRVQESVEAHADAIAVFRRVGARRLEARAKNSLAGAMFVLGRFEDAIALGLEAIRIDLAIGGRFQIARTLATIGRSFARLGDDGRARAYLGRAREAHQRYGDQDGRAETLLATAEVLLESGENDASNELIGDAGALTAVTGSAYDAVHEKILRALIARSSADSGAAVMHAFDARQVAEAQAYVAFHFYAMSIEAAARVDIGEHHTGILLATTAMGAMETIQGSEYGLETRALCAEALSEARSRQAPEMVERAKKHAEKLLASIRSAEFRESFKKRPLVARLIGAMDPAAGEAL